MEKLIHTESLALAYDTVEEFSTRVTKITMIDDEKLTESDMDTISEYTSLLDLNNLYDYLRYVEWVNRGDPKLKLITTEVDVIKFPTGSSIEYSDTQTELITADYSGDSPIYTFNFTSSIAVPFDK